MNFRIINAAIGLTVVFAALLLALFIGLTDQLPGLFGWKRWFLVGVLITYALFRIYRSIKLFKKQQHED
ncbi:MAG: hypothetical protein ACKO4Y_03330 [Flavobacteriales bacterium]